jgi:hypothetical protein
MVFSAASTAASSSRDPEVIFGRLFHVLAQPELLRKASTPQDREPTSSQDSVDGMGSRKGSSSSKTLSSSTVQDDADNEYEEELRILRTGFHELLNYIVTLRTQLSNLSEGISQISVRKSPNEYHSFLKRAMNTTGHRRLCVTKGGHIGTVPKRSKVGDSVAIFEGSNVHFILRRVKDLPDEQPSEGNEKYRLVGPAYFHMPESDGGSLATVGQNITIV